MRTRRRHRTPVSVMRSEPAEPRPWLGGVRPLSSSSSSPPRDPRRPPRASASAPAPPSAVTSTFERLVRYMNRKDVRPAATPGTPIRPAKDKKVSPMSSASSTLVGLPVTRVTAQMLPAKNCEKRKGTSGRLSNWHMRMVIGVSVMVTMSSGMRTVRQAEKQPSAQNRPHGDRPYRCTTLMAAACRKPDRSSAVVGTERGGAVERADQVGPAHEPEPGQPDHAQRRDGAHVQPRESWCSRYWVDGEEDRRRNDYAHAHHHAGPDQRVVRLVGRGEHRVQQYCKLEHCRQTVKQLRRKPALLGQRRGLGRRSRRGGRRQRRHPTRSAGLLVLLLARAGWLRRRRGSKSLAAGLQRLHGGL
eukprot:scaffold8005_cov118-Isochrysis_galbana.AAC.5